MGDRFADHPHTSKCSHSYFTRSMSFWRKARKKDLFLSPEGAVPPIEEPIVSPAFGSLPDWAKVNNNRGGRQWDADMLERYRTSGMGGDKQALFIQMLEYGPRFWIQHDKKSTE
jgi:hypothetical protein